MNIDALFPRTESNPFLDKMNRPLNFGTMPLESGKVGDKSDFQSVLKNAINEVNQLQNESDTKIGSLLKGESQDVHGTILAVQQADTSFKMMMQVRNKIVEAYKEISRSGM